MLSFRWFAILLIACAAVPMGAAPKTPPNVVFITIDTLRADHLGCYGYKQIHTPNIDGLAGDSVRFERAFTPVPVTLPTLASVLKSDGYATGAVVASAVLDSRFGLNRGFDFYYDHFDFSRLDEANLDQMERPGNVVADTTLEWLSKNYQKKFFLWMHLYDPHYPYQPPSPFSEEYKDRPYDGEIAFADQQVGRLIQFLKDKGLYSNTVIVLTGDHGESLGEHGEKTHGFFIYNATLHVPVIMHLPGEKPKALDDLISTADLMPTVLHALGITVPSEVQGRNLLPLINDAKEKEGDVDLYAESYLPRLHFDWSELRAVETDRYHFIDAPKPELYDLAKDPGETHNLFSDKRAVSEEMRGKLTEVIRRYSAGKELAEKTGLDPALMERLKSLGYAGFSGGSSPTITDRNLPDPKDRIQVYELISDAIAESQHGDYQDSVAKLNTALKTEPNSVPVHYLQGLNYYRLGQFAESVDEFQRVLKISPDYALAAFHMGLAYARSGQVDDAITTLQRALQLDGTNFTAAYDLALMYLQKKMANEALAALRQSVSITDEYAPAHRTLGELLLSMGRHDEAVVELRKAVQLMPQDPGVHAALARALSESGMSAEAQEEMRRAQELRPQ
jgi:arylsulfatase A-like enzyme/Flp pilus assembly protein TadD